MKSKKFVLVTGSSGFIASHIVDSLLEDNHNLILYDFVKSKYLKFNKKNKKYKLIEYTFGHKDFNNLEKVMKNCYCVFHFGAISDINYAQKNPIETIEKNIVFTYKLLESCKKNKISKLYFSSSIYVNTEYGGYYRISKEACEKLINEFCEKNNILYTILRFGSIYGERASLSNSITNMLYQAQNKKIYREGTGNEIRNFIHIKDTVKLCMKLFNDYKNNKKYYMVIGKYPIKISNLLRKIKKLYNDKIELHYSGKNTLHYSIYPKKINEPKISIITPSKPIDFWQSINNLKNKMKK